MIDTIEGLRVKNRRFRQEKKLEDDQTEKVKIHQEERTEKSYKTYKTIELKTEEHEVIQTGSG